jgi:hypothetical protein
MKGVVEVLARKLLERRLYALPKSSSSLPKTLFGALIKFKRGWEGGGCDKRLSCISSSYNNGKEVGLLAKVDHHYLAGRGSSQWWGRPVGTAALHFRQAIQNKTRK